MREKVRNKIGRKTKVFLVLVILSIFLASTAKSETSITNSGSTLDENLVAEYRFDTGAGDAAYDTVGNNDGTLNNFDYTASSGWTGTSSEEIAGEYPDFEGWSDQRTYTCDGTEMMGGYDNFGSSASTSKTISLPRGEYRVRFNYYFGDSWDSGEDGRLYWNGNQIWTQEGQEGYLGSENLCGAGYTDAMRTPKFASSKVSHSGGEVTLEFDSTIDQNAQDEWWGVNDIFVERIGGKQSSALNFEGDGDSVSIPYSDNLDNAFSGQKFTMSTWIYPEGGSDWADYVSANNPAGETHRIEQGGRGADSIYVTLADTSGSRPGVVRKDGVLSVGAWNHVMYTYDGSEMKLFVNGEHEGTDQASFTIGGLTGSVDINRGGQNMKMDNLRIYDAVLNLSEAKSLNSEGAFSTGDESSGISSEVLDMNFQHVQNGEVLDTSGNNNHGSIQNGATQVGSAGCKVGRCFSFDGNDDYIEISHSNQLDVQDSDFTACTWSKSREDKRQTLVAKNGGGFYSQGFQISRAGSPESIYTVVSDGDGNDIRVDTGVPGKYDWTHFCMTKNGNQIESYVNGSFVGSDSDSSLGNVNNTDPLWIGQGYEKLNGFIDQLKVYNRDLSDKEVWKLYTQGQNRFSNGMAGPVAHYPMKTESSPVVDAAGGNDGALDAIGEAGTFNTSDGNWQTVHFRKDYTDPVVVGTTNTHNGQSAIYFETRNVQSNKAEMRLCESEGGNNDGCDTHGTERGGYIVVDAASTDQVSGIEAGTFTTSSNSVSFSNGFTNTPVVFTQVMTDNSEGEVVSWVTSKDNQGFNAKICDQSSTNGCDFPDEEFGWIAVEPGNEPFAQSLEAEQLANEVGSSNWASTTFDASFSENPVGVFSVQNNDGGQDPKVDEIRNVDSNGMEMRFCELETGDNCDGHMDMAYAYLAAEKGLLTAQDSSSPKYVDTERGKALEFDGNDDYVESGSSVGVSGSESRTLTFWAKANTVNVKQHNVNWGSTSSSNAFGFWIDTSNNIYFYGHGGGYDYDTGINLDKKWHYYTVTYNGNKVNTYIDGEETPTSGISRSLSTTSSTLHIGERMDNRHYWHGKIDDVRIYPYALNQSQISRVMNGGAVNIG